MTRTPPRWSPAILLVLAGSTHTLAGSFPGAFDVASLDGINGFVAYGFSASGEAGWSVASLGDVNGDGVDDAIIGSYSANEAYVVFGGPGVGATGSLDLLTLNGANGFVIEGVGANDFCGYSVSGAGDVNFDGINDIVIGAPVASPGGHTSAGETYVVFGRDTASVGEFPPALDLSILDGSNGFAIRGIDAQDSSGTSVSGAGDVNGDGVDDVIIGAPGGSPNDQTYAGEAYVVFGRDTASVGNFPAALDLSSLNGANGFTIHGIAEYDSTGKTVSSAGDVNDDGVDDVIIGAPFADPGGRNLAGRAYVVFGRDTESVGNFPAALELSSLTGSNGFTIDGVEVLDKVGTRVSGAGDINADGIDDFLVGAITASPNGQAYAGETYAVFGAPTLGAGGSIDLTSLDGSNGFVSYGIAPNDASGIGLAAAGDVNGDGADDLVVGASNAARNGQSYAGECYVVYAKSTVGFGGILLLSSLEGTAGFVINGADMSSRMGLSVSSAGDLNAAGTDDLIIGAPDATPPGRSYAGECYVIFGRRTCAGDLDGDGHTNVFDFGLFARDFGCPH